MHFFLRLPFHAAAILVDPEKTLSMDIWRRWYALHRWVVYGGEIALLLLAVWAARVFFVRRLRRWAERHQTSHSYIVLNIVIQGLTPFLLLGVAAVALNLLELPTRFLNFSNRALSALTLIVIAYLLTKVLQIVLVRWLSKDSSGSYQESVSFFTRVIFGILAGMILLERLFEIQLHTVWTTLGIGGVAIALALQDTLSNFFSGVYLRLDNPVQVGDYIKIEGSEEGFIGELGWRSARMRTLANNVVIVPNNKLASTILTNYSAPVMEGLLLISIKVSQEADPEQVKRTLLDEITNAAKDIEGLQLDPPPVVRLIPKLGEPMQDYAVNCSVTDTSDRYSVRRRLRARLLARLAKEGISSEGASNESSRASAPASSPVNPPGNGTQPPPMAKPSDSKHPLDVLTGR